MKNLSTEKRFLFSEVIKLIKIILIAPATNAISGGSFSTLKRVKTSTHSTMTDIKIILIAPATNSISESSFSSLKRVKTSTHSTMTGSRLNHLLLIQIYKEELDEIDIKLITNEFIKIKESRIATFGLYQF